MPGTMNARGRSSCPADPSVTPRVALRSSTVLGDVCPVADPGENFTRLGKGEFTVDTSKAGIAEPDRKRPLQWHLAVTCAVK
jgi:hypothetical protein